IVLLVLSSFLWYALFLSVTGAQYSVLLALFAGLFDFIPVVGPLVGGLLIFIITGLTGYSHLIAFVIFWAVLRLFQDYVLSPYLMGAGVELDPLVVLFGVLAGEQIAGIPGMFFSVPILATLRVIFVRMQRARARRMIGRTMVETPRIENIETGS
ncbi:MAG: AI-2E family transporter, partial [Bryobacteraceae bacterium]